MLGKYTILCGFIALLATSCDSNNSTEQKEAPTATPVNVVANGVLDSVLTQYVSVQTKLVDWDSAGAKTQALALDSLLGKLEPEALTKVDTLVPQIGELLAAVKGEVKSIQKETTLTEQRRSFYTLSSALQELLVQTGYNAKKVYVGHCPMAFNDEEEAKWLSLTNEVVNPYLGNKHPIYKAGMLHCGEIVDSLGSK
jgi:hypothetical protein